MMTQTLDIRVNPHAPVIRSLPVRKMLTSAIPFIAVAVPGAAYAQDVTNTATVTAPSGTTDPDSSNNSATDTDTLLATLLAVDDDFTGSPILSTGGSTSTVFVNDTINGATVTTGDVTVSILDDDGLTGVSIASDGTITVPAGTTPGTYNVEYQICEDGQPTNCDSAIATILVGGVSDLQTVKVLTSGTAEPAVGDTVTFTITVTNNGGDDATNVSLTDLLPAGLTATVNNGTVSQGSYDSGTGVWTVGSLANGAFATLTIEGTVDAGQEGNTITNTTSAATSDQNDPTTTGDDLDESVDVINTIVANDDDFSGSPILSTGGSTGSVFGDDTINGAAFANGDVTATITDDDGLTGVSINADGTLSVPAGATPGTYNVTYQICETADPDNCDTAIATVVVGGVADLQTVKVRTSSTAEPAVGDTVTYTITVTNNGGDDATNVSLTDLLPAGLTATVNNGTVSQGSYDSGTGVWTVGSLANGAFATLTIEGTVDAGQEGNTITNTTTAATSDQNDPTTTGDDLDESVTVINTIVANDNDFSGTSVPSTGGDTASVFPNDTLNGAGFADAAVIPTIVDDDGLTGVTINADGTLTIPSGATPGTYNVQYQICEAADTDNCDTAIATVVVGAVVDLSIAKTNNVTEVRSGDTVTYVLTVSNAGPDAATGALVTDTPGTGLSCPATGTITFGGTAAAGAPAGSPTVGDLQGAGITLGTIGAGENVTITYSCSVN
ncbi:DUF11 domain-containing protein [Aurantiacibacter sp. D1-12]|uniref:DUF11 domain-containing protein n=1 Tax=Aurantiacibacter sp. D1-12 TaxID=2993658 RepID=UPI00237D0758|nr:DUF11 domain-containing protein [Aurantiacibacter sp. D1-12]MDE1467102.1 DUF11 domain-containing protein [Aurantiacibacter sp. D1-12]